MVTPHFPVARIALSEEVCRNLKHHGHPRSYGRVWADSRHAPSRFEIKTASMHITAGHIKETVLLGRGIFRLQLVELEDVEHLVHRSW